MQKRLPTLVAAISASWALILPAQQLPDRTFQPAVPRPSYPRGEGPVVCVDQAHFNFHTLDGRFWAFGELLRVDGYRVRANRSRFDPGALAACTVLVIANAQPSDVDWDDYPYPTPSAFAAAEVTAVDRWVRHGGRLLLIADHMPLAGAAAGLAAAFGVRFRDGFAVDGFVGDSGRNAAFEKPTIFGTRDGTLRAHAIVKGRDPGESVASVRTFLGQAFQIPPGAEGLLVLPSTFTMLMPTKAWQFRADTRRVAVGGWSQGAVIRVGSGRVGVFGEAAMFTAQVQGPNREPLGMNAPGAEQNFQFVLNLLRWLSAHQRAPAPHPQ